MIKIPNLKLQGQSRVRRSNRIAAQRTLFSSTRQAWPEPSPSSGPHLVTNISGQIDEDVTPSQCIPPAVPMFFEEVRKYLKPNIYSLVIISCLLPYNALILAINVWDLKKENWGLFAENFLFCQTVFFFLYPYYVKVKLDNFV